MPVGVLVGVSVTASVGVCVGTAVSVGELVGVSVGVLVAVSVGVWVGVAVSAVPSTVRVKSVNRAGFSMRFPARSTICVSRVMGAGGENCQCNTAVPGAIAHRPISASRNIPPQPTGQLRSPPEA